MATITKKEIANRIADRLDHRKVVVKDVIQEFIQEIIAELAQGNRLEFREFGVFEIKERAARLARNPRTGVEVDVPCKAVVSFRAGRAMRERVQDSLASPVEASTTNGSGTPRSPLTHLRSNSAVTRTHSTRASEATI